MLHATADTIFFSEFLPMVGLLLKTKDEKLTYANEHISNAVTIVWVYNYKNRRVTPPPMHTHTKTFPGEYTLRSRFFPPGKGVLSHRAIGAGRGGRSPGRGGGGCGDDEDTEL